MIFGKKVRRYDLRTANLKKREIKKRHTQREKILYLPQSTKWCSKTHKKRKRRKSEKAIVYRLVRKRIKTGRKQRRMS